MANIIDFYSIVQKKIALDGVYLPPCMKTSVGLAVSATKDTRFCCTRSDIAHSSLDGPVTLINQSLLAGI